MMISSAKTLPFIESNKTTFYLNKQMNKQFFELDELDVRRGRRMYLAHRPIVVVSLVILHRTTLQK